MTKKKRKFKKKKQKGSQGLKKRVLSTEVFPCMRNDINSWDRHMILMFNYSRKT
ncbi:MAG: hypothetical protein ACFFEY_20820 [Candidatus Thorarchaeota archaeon]